MDELDFAILRQVLLPHAPQWNVRLSYAEMGRALGQDAETIRLRVRRMEDSGVIRGWQVVVNAGVLGRTFVRYDLDPIPADSRAKIEAALVAMEGAHLLLEHLGERFALIAYQTPGAPTKRQAALIAAVAGAPPLVVPKEMPPPTIDLTTLDWRILRAIRASPRAAYQELAADLGVSERTLRRRVERLIEGRAVVHDVDVDFGRIEGATVSTLHVAFEEDAPREGILRVLGQLPHLYRQLEGPRVRVTYAAPNVAAAEALRRQIEEMAEGRAEVRIELILRRVCLREWLDAEIAARAA